MPLPLYMIVVAQALSVSVNGESIGTVRERATWWNPVYHIFDSVGNQVFKIRYLPTYLL